MFKMAIIKDIVNIIGSGHSMTQKSNYIRYKISKKAEVLSYSPVTISIVATSRCTLFCDMCPTHSRLVPQDYPHRQRNEKDISFGMFKEIIDKFASAVNVQIIGSGEPLLNKDFFMMVDYASAKRMTVKTFSNGTTIRENIDKILDSGLSGITISINGHDSKEFKRLTGMDERIYAAIHDAARLLIEEKKRRRSGLKVKLSFIIDRYNYRSIPHMIDCALKLDADHSFFCNFLPCPFESLNADERVLTADRQVINDIKDMVNGYPSSVRRTITLPTLVDRSLKTNRCEAHFSQIRFDGDGNVSSCSMMLLNMTGQGRYGDDGVWNNAFFRDMRRRFLANDERLLEEPCRVCPDNKGVDIR